MNMKYLLIVLFLAITSSCANQSKKEVAQTTPLIAQNNTTSTEQATPPAPSKTKNAVMIDAFTCSRDSDVREIYIESVTPKGCKLWYSNKKGSPIAQSALSIEHCEKVNANIRRNLETAGFKCQMLKTSI